MAKEIKKYDWNSLFAMVQDAEPTIWSKILELTGGSEEIKPPYFGYQINPGNVLNFAPRIVYEADIDLPETMSTNPDKVEKLIANAAAGVQTEKLRLKLIPYRFYPQMQTLEKDPVFGTDPLLPKRITCTLKADKEPFKIG